MSRFMYSYDAKDQLVKTELRNEKDRTEARQEFGYDTLGNPISEKWFDQNNKLHKDLRFEGAPASAAAPPVAGKKPALAGLAKKPQHKRP